MARREREAKKSFSVRWSPRTLAHLQRHAEGTKIAANVLAERYVEEGLRMTEHPLVYFREGAAGRRPALIGTRLDVATVISTVRQNNNSVEEAADYLQLRLPLVEACVRYYVDYQDEIDAWIARDEEETEAAEISWRKRQEIFT
jgi:uncharacterized protein (DUF433 family)